MVRLSCLVSLVVLCLCALAPVARAEIQEFGWTAEGFIDPAAGEGERVQIAIDDTGTPIAVWTARALVTDPFRLVASRFENGSWTEAAPILPQVTIDERLPQLSRAPDGTLWLAWLRHDDDLGSSEFAFSTLMAARYTNGAWSTPEIVTEDMARPNPETTGIEFTILGVNTDSAWIAFTPTSRSDPFTAARDLYWSAHSASGWSTPGLVTGSAFNESRPVLAIALEGQPVVFFGYRDEPTMLHARRWDGNAWIAATGDVVGSLRFFQWAAAPDTSGAVRLLVMQRESGPPEYDRIYEYTWNAMGFTRLQAIAESPVVGGQGNDPPQWDGLSYALGKTLVYRGFWMDYTIESVPILASIERTSIGFEDPEFVGRAYAPDLAYPNGAYDLALDRWYATWIGAPSSISIRRPKFAWTQDFAGELGIGASYIAPDTVRVTVACTGDAEGRTFHIYRLRWDDTETIPPFPPPIPGAAVEIASSPTSGTCPFKVDDFPGEGRWYYYVLLDQLGTFPERAARTFTPLIVPDDGGGGGDADVTALRPPRPTPAFSTAVSLPFDLATAGDVTLTIFDLSGRVRRVMALGSKAAGSYTTNAPVWDRRDDAGVPMTTGMYFVRLTVDGRAHGTQRVILVSAPSSNLM